MPARYAEIARVLREGIMSATYPVGAHLPSEPELMRTFGAARGTVRQAVTLLAAEGLIGVRQGARRVVLRNERSQSFAELHSFAQWAHLHGYEIASRVHSQRRRPATEVDCRKLNLSADAQVLEVLRVRSLDGEPVLLERTVYPPFLADEIEQLPADCVSVTESLRERVGTIFAYGEHLIDAVAAGSTDARLLGVRRGSPLLRQRRTTTTPDGTPAEYSDDRYRPDSVTFSIRNSVGENPLHRLPLTPGTPR
ncbi:GntR family transcriptional regulator [Nocardia mangyaensis]|uniref:GntR family transcriptional regulator n=1 Tax=Nocardia mangyaensis TaxID=2213200 RepID=UPI002674B262|nr:GntR family transcriptional regulator [Nocardia mangyaensis]MDO3651200.1 GntR family transcriptional regulator [Nocardia mangyaensis]